MKIRWLFITTVAFWIIVGGMVVRTNRLWFGPVTFHWSNLKQSNATFRWSTAPAGRAVIIPEKSTKSFKVIVPRKFASGELVISTVPDSSSLLANIDAPAGQTNITGSNSAAGVITLPLTWDGIAVQTRTFNVELVTDNQPVTLKAITLKLR